MKMRMQIVWQVVTIAILNSCKSDDVLAPQTYCGFQHIDDYVRDNDKISLDEFPWAVQLLSDDGRKVKCVGSLINSRYVLTTSMCVIPRDDYTVGVRLGEYDVTNDRDCTNHTSFGEECSDPVQEFDVEEVIPHPAFNYRNATNDIGLIRLSKPVQYSDYIRPICLPTTNTLKLEEGDELVATGWGLDSYGNETKIKKKVFGRLVSFENCSDVYKRSNRRVNRNHLCLLEDRDSFTCGGDGGGPLMYSVQNQWYQVGIVSFGFRCGLKFPSVYTNVINYIDWIKENLRK